MALTYVTASIMAREGCEADLEAELKKVVPLVRAEDGCIRYDLHRNEYGNAFFFYEIWESPAHLAAHGKTPHMEAMLAVTGDLSENTAVNIWEAADVAD